MLDMVDGLLWADCLVILDRLLDTCAFGDTGANMLRQGLRTKVAGVAVNGLKVWLPGAEVFLGHVENLPRGDDVLERRVCVARDHGSVVEQVQQLSRILSKQDLLLCALDDGGRVDVVGLLELLTGDVGQLGFGDKRLSFGTDELLLELNNLGRGWLLVFQLLDLVLNLLVMLVGSYT